MTVRTRPSSETDPIRGKRRQVQTSEMIFNALRPRVPVLPPPLRLLRPFAVPSLHAQLLAPTHTTCGGADDDDDDGMVWFDGLLRSHGLFDDGNKCTKQQ